MIYLLQFFVAFSALANPYFDKTKIPKDTEYPRFLKLQQERASSDETSAPLPAPEALPALRITLNWNEKSESYTLGKAVIEQSGTDSLNLRSKKQSPWGSYQGQIRDEKTAEIRYDSIGTGREYRKLARAITFRFPVPQHDFDFKMNAENPDSGEMEEVFKQHFTLQSLQKTISPKIEGLDIQTLKEAKASPKIIVGIYADGYSKENKARFFKDAQSSIDALASVDFPELVHMEFVAVFAPSNLELGKAELLGFPIKERDSFLGLYYPYWDNFGRWYNIVYPTSEEKFRSRLATIPYDYNIVLMDSDQYFGVGNYKTHTAIPTREGDLVYLLLHEFGHFFGLNEEYEGGGRTELEFAKDIVDPWSQNMTLLGQQSSNQVKWSTVVKKETPIPTPESYWESGMFGAYRGGYADSELSRGHNHKPGLDCVMERGPDFCQVCKNGIGDVIHHDLGM